MKKLISRSLLGCVIIAAVGVMTTLALSLSWFGGTNNDDEKQAIDGEIGLRGYYYSGKETFRIIVLYLL